MAENLSGIPPAVTLSGLQQSPAGMSGVPGAQAGLGGGGYGGGLPGMEGGMDLATLLQMLGGGEDSTVGTGGSLTAGLGAGSFGSAGGIGSDAFGQTQPGYTAGQTSMGGQTQGQNAAAGAADPFSIIQKFLGTAGKLAGGLGGTASPTAGSDLTLEGQLFQPEGASTIGTSSPTIEQDFAGALQSPFLSDPTLGPLFTQGLLSGSLTPNDIAQMGTLAPDQLQGLRTALYEGGTQSDLGSQLLGGSGGGGFTLGTGNATSNAPGANWGGLLGGGTQATSGLLNILQGIQGDNAYQGAGGGIQSASGLLSLLKSSPELAQQLGLTSGALGGAGAGIEGLGAILNLLQGIESGNAGQIGSGAIGGVTAANSASQALGGADYLGTAAGGAGAYLPLVGALLQGLTADMSPQGQDATSAQAGMGAALSAASFALMGNPITAMFGPVLGVALAINQAMNPYNKFAEIGTAATQLGEGGMRQGQQANDIFSQAQDQGITDPNALMQVLQYGSNALFPFYQQMQGSRGQFSAQDWLKRIEGGPQADLAAQYRQTQQQLLNNVFNTIGQLSQAGVTPQQFGALNVNPQWAETYLGGGPVAENRPGGVGDLSAVGGMDAGQAALAMYGWLSPENTNTVTGGPLMSMLSYLNPDLYRQIGGGFNYTDPAVQEILARNQQSIDTINQQMYQDFTSGGM